MDTKSGFEIMAENDCFLFEAEYGNTKFGSYAFWFDVVGTCGYLISFMVGFLILSKERYKKYPFKIVGLICLVQSGALFC